MTEKPSKLENELASLQPIPLSDACARGIDRALLNSAQPSLRLYPRRFLLVAALAAACLLVAAITYWGIISEQHRPLAAEPVPAPGLQHSQSLATVAVYRQAIASDSSALDALLDHEAAASLPPRPGDNLLRAGFASYSASGN